MRIFIIGYMGSGKSTIGPLLANEMDIPFFDLDDVFETRYRISIQNFFLKYGEVQFREIEHNLLIEFAQMEDFILATGGGTPCNHNNLEIMNHIGITVFLHVPIEILIKRLKYSPKKRPVLKNFINEDFEKHLEEHLQRREFFYNQALITLEWNQLDPPDVAHKIRQMAIRLPGG